MIEFKPDTKETEYCEYVSRRAGDSLNYENVIELLLQEFPNLRKGLEADDYLSDLPHCIFEIILVPYVKKLCENEEKEDLIKLGKFLEKMAICEDEKVNELLNVSFLEPIVLADKKIIPFLQNHLGKMTLKELDYWQNRYLVEQNL